MNSNRKMNKARYFKNGTNIYPYASLSYQLISLIKWVLITLLGLYIVNLLLGILGKVSYVIMTKFAPSTGGLETISAIKRVTTGFFASIYQWTQTVNIISWISIGQKTLILLIVGYIVTLALRRHNYELRPFRDDVLSYRYKRKILKSYEISTLESNSQEDGQGKTKSISAERQAKNERYVRDVLRHMNVTVNTRKEINGDDFKSICSVVIETPRNNRAKKLLKNMLKDFSEELTDATDGDFIFGSYLKEKGGKSYFFLAEQDMTEFYAEKIQKSQERRAKWALNKDEELVSTKPTERLYKEEESSWSIDLLTDRSKNILKEKKLADEEAKEIEAQVELYMSSNPEMSAQLDEVKVSNAFVGIEYSIPRGKKVDYTKLADEIEQFAGVNKPLISLIKRKLVISVPLTNRVNLDAKGVVREAFENKKISPLTAIFGANSEGKVITYDIGKSPHMLVAGTSGSGKSVGVNQIILSIMKHSTPDEVKFIMIDPKMVELAVYKGNPFLLADPITEIKKMPKALGFLVIEQDDRYREFAKYGVRNIDGYNKKMEQEGKKKMPKIVVVVDEFSDMMSSASKVVESYIVRIGQKARAAGIHMIIATQSPRAEVVTGLIKANISTRLAYQVTSSLESRIILDEDGGEILVGAGDSFLKWKGNRKERLLAIFIDDDETERINKAIKEKYGETEKVDYIKIFNRRQGELVDDGEDEDEDDYVSSDYLGGSDNDTSIEIVNNKVEKNFSFKKIEALDSEDTTSTPDELKNEFKKMEANRQIALEKMREQQRVPKITPNQEKQTENGIKMLLTPKPNRNASGVRERLASQIQGGLTVIVGDKAVTTDPKTSKKVIDTSDDDLLDSLIGDGSIDSNFNDYQEPTTPTHTEEHKLTPKVEAPIQRNVEMTRRPVRPTRPNRPSRPR